MTVPFDLTCWYLNARRIVALTGMNALNANRVATSDHWQRLAELHALERSIVAWIKGGVAKPIDKLFLEGEANYGKLITLHTNFFFNGLPALGGPGMANRRVSRAPRGYAKLDHLKPGLKLTFEFYPEHLTSNSAWVELTGQKRMFMLGLITQASELEIVVKPYVLGNLVENSDDLFSGQRWWNHLEVHVDQIDTFSKVKELKRSRSKKALEILKTIPEQKIKEAFAEIIGEGKVPKDWGGETSDLFSSAVELEGKRISAAFAFKGPAKFHSMTMADLGKNGDQINRLFEEPAELLILQHCHEVMQPVRKTMRAYSQQMGNPRLFCIIDGFDTLRVLQVYQQCGFGPTDVETGIN